jgi:heme A synthase
MRRERKPGSKIYFTVFLVTFIRLIGGMDELQRRIQLEALAVAFPLAILLLMTLGLLQRAIHLPFEDWSYAHVWAYLPIFYFIGLVVANRRYHE